MTWTTTRKKRPERRGTYEVTLEDKDGARATNLAGYTPENSSWYLLLNKEDFRDFKVIAWKERSEPYIGPA